MKSNMAVSVRNVSVLLEGNMVLEGIDLDIHWGEMVGIIGPNGAGKTTLLRLMLGLLDSYRGTVQVMGSSPSRLGEKRDAIGYLPQRPEVTPQFPLSVLDVVSMGLITPNLVGRPLGKKCRQLAWDCLEKVGLLPLINKPFTQLSGGERQRVFLARALIKSPCLLFLDEPNAGLDLPTQNRFMTLLKNLQEQQELTIVMVSHDLAVMAGYADRLICINRTMHVHGSPAEVMESPRLGEAYRCKYELLFGREEKKEG